MKIIESLIFCAATPLGSRLPEIFLWGDPLRLHAKTCGVSGLARLTPPKRVLSQARPCAFQKLNFDHSSQLLCGICIVVCLGRQLRQCLLNQCWERGIGAEQVRLPYRYQLKLRQLTSVLRLRASLNPLEETHCC